MSTALILSLVVAIYVFTGVCAWCILRVGSNADQATGGQQ